MQISYNTGARMQKTSELNCSDALTIYHLTIHNHITQVSLGTHLTHRRESPHTGVRMERPHTGVSRHFQIRGCAIQTHNNALTLLLYFYSNWTMIYKSFSGPRRRNLLLMSDR